MYQGQNINFECDFHEIQKNTIDKTLKLVNGILLISLIWLMNKKIFNLLNLI